jgi:hypothetical protein
MTVANISLVLGQCNAIGFGTYDGVTFTAYPGGMDGRRDEGSHLERGVRLGWPMGRA